MIYVNHVATMMGGGYCEQYNSCIEDVDECTEYKGDV